MAETVSVVAKITDKEKFPEGLARFEALGFDDKNHLVGIEESGDSTQIQKLGLALVEFAVKNGAAEEIVEAEISPEAQSIIDELQARNRQLEEQLRQERLEHAEEIERLQADFYPKTVRMRPPAYTRAWYGIRGQQAPSRTYDVDAVGPYRADRHGRRVYIEEERNERARLAAAAGVLAAAGALIFGVWNHHELEELEHRTPVTERTVANPGADQGPNGHSLSQTGDYSGFHVGWYNSDTKVTGVGFSRQVKLKLQKQGSGKFAFVGDGVRINNVGWDSQGKLDYPTRNALKRYNYKLDWGALDQENMRKITIVKR